VGLGECVHSNLGTQASETLERLRRGSVHGGLPVPGQDQLCSLAWAAVPGDRRVPTVCRTHLGNGWARVCLTSPLKVSNALCPGNIDMSPGH
jgi:hypothetical protein